MTKREKCRMKKSTEAKKIPRICFNLITNKPVYSYDKEEFIKVWEENQGGGAIIRECIEEAKDSGESLLNHNGNLWLFSRIEPLRSEFNVPKNNQVRSGEYVILRCYEGMIMNDEMIEAEYALF